MKISYYPGCTLKTKAKNLDDSSLAAMSALDIDLVELPRWNCCGTVYSLADDDLVHHLAPLRNLIRVKEQGDSKVVTLCSFCYNTLKRANLMVRKDAEKRKTLNDFMSEERDYEGDVEVLHLLELLRDEVGWENLSEKVRKPLKGLKIACYYGCTLLRPQEVALDQVEKPTVMEKLMRTIGAEVIDFPFATECCGSYQAVANPEFALQRAWEILSSTLRWGGEALALSCPLCSYNLDQIQRELRQKYGDFPGIPILYFSQLLALSLGLDVKVCRFDLNYIDPRPLLRSKQLIS